MREDRLGSGRRGFLLPLVSRVRSRSRGVPPLAFAISRSSCNVSGRHTTRADRSIASGEPAERTAEVPAPGDGADELVCKPGPVPGRLSAVPFGDHPSRRAVADTLQRFTRKLGRAALERLRTPGRHASADLVLSTLLRVGFTEPCRSPGTLVVSYTTVSPLPRGPRAEARTPRGGLFSVALSRGSRRVAVDNHPALWSPDFPRRSAANGVPTRSPDQLVRAGLYRRPAHPQARRFIGPPTPEGDG